MARRLILIWAIVGLGLALPIILSAAKKPLSLKNSPEPRIKMDTKDFLELFKINPERAQQFQDFLREFHKSYSGPELLKRFKIFCDKSKYVDDWNKLYDEGKVSYNLGINQFADMTDDEYHHMLGVKIPPQLTKSNP